MRQRRAESRPGGRYWFRLDGPSARLGAGDRLRPDPASRWQPDGPHGPSAYVDPRAFAWTDAGWKGLTRDGQYYVIAILPITAPILSDSSDPAAVVPAGGIPYPDINDANADWNGYYAAVSALLDATPFESFSPALSHLDLLIQSIRVAP